MKMFLVFKIKCLYYGHRFLYLYSHYHLAQWYSQGTSGEQQALPLVETQLQLPPSSQGFPEFSLYISLRVRRYREKMEEQGFDHFLTIIHSLGVKL